MTFPKGHLRRVALVGASTIGALVVSASPAAAAVDDSFTLYTTDGGCGMVEFVDYGPGAPGGGNNDDYLVIHDYCSDGDGVQVWASLFVGGWSERDLGTKYNGNGRAGAAVVWDPFSQFSGNVNAGDTVQLQVCVVDGKNGPEHGCNLVAVDSADG
ncbi:hypothetical protein [Couchioplanes azureus]|uniref:hypothetical protein n=1 Tax=Couchioplanes caeruleus TaxID=56438 RepID=UPI001670FA19|nr:hypothetical protein [Couchioplanes caeruleus]GGQ73756.1 hypothetical protein GCM10010166_49910 [Couchioplanes caeruleus subsp. azureus]